MKPKSLISIIMPCYNAGRYVGAAIESILVQSFQDFELIVINDGSSDNSHQEILKYTDSRIRYTLLEKPPGNYPARNAGIAMARGKYICVMDADDIAFKDRLQVQYNYLKCHHRIGAIGGQGKIINNFGELTGRMTNPLVSSRQLGVFLLMNNFVAHPTLMIRSSLLHKHQLRYNEAYTYASDFDFIYRCCALFPVQNIDYELIQYRHHAQQISSKHRSMQENYADHIRLSQLKSRNFQLFGEERIYLSLMRKKRLSSMEELTMGMNLLNNLLDQNKKLKAFNKGLFLIKRLK